MPHDRRHPARAVRRAGRRSGEFVRAVAAVWFGPAARQSLVALAFNSATSLAAGATLGAITGTLETYPGMLVMIPAAIGLRGNIFSTLGSRLSTAIHTGEFELTARRDGVLRQNVDAAVVLTLGMSVVLALMAWVIAATTGVARLASPWQLVVISVVGGMLGSVVVLVATVALAAAAVRRDWELDNLVAPVVSTLGDVLTLPALWLASGLAGLGAVTTVLGVVLVLAGSATLIAGARSERATVRRVVRTAPPVLVAAALLSTLGGLALEHRLVALAAVPALLVLQPAFVSSAGALGGILSARMASDLHLGLTVPRWWPDRHARATAGAVAALVVPVGVFNGVGAHLVARALGVHSPGLGSMLTVALAGGAVAVTGALAVAYYATAAAVTLRLDPDDVGIPLVTSAIDFFGALVLLGVAAAAGVLAT